MQFATTYALHVKQRDLHLTLGPLHLSPEAIFGLLMSWNGIFVMIFELPLTTWTLRFDARRVMALGYLLSGFGFALNGFVHTLGGLFVAMTLFSIGEVISAPTASALVARIAPENLRGRYMGALALSWNVAGIVAPQIGFRLFAIDPLVLWSACAVLGALAALVILRSGRLATDSL
jgi:MFS family permease